MRGRLACVAFVMLLAGCAGSPSANEDGRTPLDSAAQPVALVMLQDNGFNPYHVGFRDDSPRAFQHPSTYLAGYPEDAIPLHLSLNATTFEEAARLDCPLWANTTAEQVYWFPGTTIVSAITFSQSYAGAGEGDCDGDAPILRFLGGSHGTMTSSRAASQEYGACKRCLVGMVIGFDTAGVGWIGEQESWVDVQSHSWGPVAPVFVPTDETGLAPTVSDPDFNNAVEDGAQRVLSFWASGNGAATRGGVVGHPTVLTPHFGPSVVIVGGHDSGYVNTWPGFTPHLVSDSCNSWAAHHGNMTTSADDVGGGTSGATPYVAGIAADLLVEARALLGDVGRTGRTAGIVAQGTAPAGTTGPLDDGQLTWAEWREVLYKTATPRPQRQYEDGSTCVDPLNAPYGSTPVMWTQVPEDAPAYVYLGYGAADNESRALAYAVLRGDAPLPERSDEDQYFAVYEPARALVGSVARGG